MGKKHSASQKQLLQSLQGWSWYLGQEFSPSLSLSLSLTHNTFCIQNTTVFKFFLPLQIYVLQHQLSVLWKSLSQTFLTHHKSWLLSPPSWSLPPSLPLLLNYPPLWEHSLQSPSLAYKASDFSTHFTWLLWGILYNWSETLSYLLSRIPLSVSPLPSLPFLPLPFQCCCWLESWPGLRSLSTVTGKLILSPF